MSYGIANSGADHTFVRKLLSLIKVRGEQDLVVILVGHYSPTSLLPPGVNFKARF